MLSDVMVRVTAAVNASEVIPASYVEQLRVNAARCTVRQTDTKRDSFRSSIAVCRFTFTDGHVTSAESQ